MLATVATLATVCLVLPTVTESQPGPEFTSGQLAFAAVASLALYLAFVVTQTVRHRDFFLPVAPDGEPLDRGRARRPADARATPGSRSASCCSSLVAVVGLAKIESPAIEDGVLAVGLPVSFVGVVIALLVLLPETLAAANAARRGRVQTSLNLALGSAMASIGLTIPTLAVASIWIPTPLHLGLGADPDRAAGHHRGRGGADRRARAGDPAAGERAPHPLRGVPLPRDVPLRPQRSRIGRESCADEGSGRVTGRVPPGWRDARRAGSTRRRRSGRPRKLTTLAGRHGVGRQRAAGRADVGAVGGLEVLDPPALPVGGQLRLPAAHPGVAGAVDLRGGCCGSSTAGRRARSCAASSTTAGRPGDGQGSSLSCAAYQSGSTHTSATQSTAMAGASGRRVRPPAGRVGVRAGRGVRRARHRAGGEVVAAGLAEQGRGVVGRAAVGADLRVGGGAGRAVTSPRCRRSRRVRGRTPPAADPPARPGRGASPRYRPGWGPRRCRSSRSRSRRARWGR